VIQCGGRVGAIEDDLVQSIMVREVDGVVAKPSSPFKIGEVVSIAGGPFDGLVATILSMDDKDRLIVLMDLLNRPVKVALEAGQLSPIVRATT
jgi:transcriptional antiterminator RfaH